MSNTLKMRNVQLPSITTLQLNSRVAYVCIDGLIEFVVIRTYTNMKYGTLGSSEGGIRLRTPLSVTQCHCQCHCRCDTIWPKSLPPKYTGIHHGGTCLQTSSSTNLNFEFLILPRTLTNGGRSWYTCRTEATSASERERSERGCLFLELDGRQAID